MAGRRYIAGGTHWRQGAAAAALIILSGVVLKYRSEIADWAMLLQHHAHSDAVNLTAIDGPDVMFAQYVCSAQDAVQVKRLTPIDTLAQLQSDSDSLNAKQIQLEDLKTQIVVAPTAYLAGPSDMDYRKQLVDQYNALLASYRTDEGALKQRTETFNSQTLARKKYLQQHCRTAAQ
jgi:hypothetical protein